MSYVTISSAPYPDLQAEMEIRLYWKARRTKYQTKNQEISSSHSMKPNMPSSGEKARISWLT